jgi:hypothetical protein
VANAACSQGIFEKHIQLFLLFRRHWIDFSKSGRRFTLEFDGVVPFSTFGEMIEGALTKYIFEFV